MNFTSKLFSHIVTAFFFLQPDVWNTCLFRSIFATWLSQTRSHLHINSHRRTPDAKIATYGKMYINFLFAVPRAICFGALLQITQTITWFVFVKPKFSLFSFLFYDLSKNGMCSSWETVAGKLTKQTAEKRNKKNTKSGSSQFIWIKTLMLSCNQWENKARVNVRDECVSEG